jgi:hypothetical protein
MTNRVIGQSEQHATCNILDQANTILSIHLNLQEEVLEQSMLMLSSRSYRI